MTDLLVVFQQHDIPECISSLEALDIDKAWLKGYAEKELVDVFPDLVDDTDYDRYIAVKDEFVVRQEALDAVLGLLDDYPVVTGWSNLARHDWRANVSPDPITLPPRHGYYTRYEVMARPHEAFSTRYVNWTLTGMSRDLWVRFPFVAFPVPGMGGRIVLAKESELALSARLQAESVPAVIARDAFCYRVRDDLERDDRSIVGTVEPEVRMEVTASSS